MRRKTSGSGSTSLILTQNKPLRLLTLLLFYCIQGFPVGVYFYAIPAWMSGGGASTAAVVALAALPWSLKLINGFLIDRYTFLPMCCRRAMDWCRNSIRRNLPPARALGTL